MINKIKTSFCKNNKDNTPILKELTKEELKLKLTTFDNKIIKKDEAPAFVGGYFDGKGRTNENLLGRTLITLDIDNYNGSISDLEAFLDDTLNEYEYIAHSTSSHTKDKPKIRILLFPSKEIKPNEYENIVINFCKQYSISDFIDKSCATPVQIMYLPIKTSNDYIAWTKTNKGGVVDIDLFTSKYYTSNTALNDRNCDNNFDFIALKPTCNLSDEDIRDYLKRYDVSKTNYPMWRDVGMALHHQYSGDNKGKELFAEWSCQDIRPEYEDKAKVRETVSNQYDSFSLDKTNLITFATIIYRIQEIEREERKKAILTQIDQLSNFSTEKEVEKIINTLATYYTENESENYLQLIKGKTKWQISNLKNMFKAEQSKIEYNKVKSKPVIVPLNQPLPRGVFVNDKNLKKAPRATYDNFLILLENYNIKIRYNLISKNNDIIVPKQQYSNDNRDNAGFADIISICKLNHIETGCIESYIIKVGEVNKYNPVLEFIESKSWDGVSRLNDLYNTITTQQDFPLELKELLFRKWLISGIAALREPRFYSKGVLVFQGEQSLGKTAWLKKLLPFEIEQYFKEGCTLDPANKDSVKTAISHWIVELGELDATFKKDIARLKAFITSDKDIFRLPYAHKDSYFSRRTIFCGSVNSEEFLIDSTGNHRFWVIPVIKIDYKHNIDMQQLWVEVNEMYKKGQQWWLTPDEEQKLEFQNQNHLKKSPLEEQLREHFIFQKDVDFDSKIKKKLNASEILSHLGYHKNQITKALRSEIVQVLHSLEVERSSHDKTFMMTTKEENIITSNEPESY
jgi:putative DNA primase/helicase